MSGHTPGLWKRDRRGMTKFIVRSGDGRFVADVRAASRTDAENEANADFIVAAPATAVERDKLREGINLIREASSDLSLSDDVKLIVIRSLVNPEPPPTDEMIAWAMDTIAKAKGEA